MPVTIRAVIVNLGFCKGDPVDKDTPYTVSGDIKMNPRTITASEMQYVMQWTHMDSAKAELHHGSRMHSQFSVEQRGKG